MSESASGKPLRIGIAGLGTVGAGVLKLLTQQQDMLASRAGVRLEVTAVSARNRQQDRGVGLGGYTWYDNCLDMADADDIDVVVELIGGADGTAKVLVDNAIAAGKHVVTANKALLAYHGQGIAEAAEARSVAVGFEAAVAGGVPVIKGLRDGLAANHVERIVAILNGTCNFVLGLMEEEEVSFDDAVREAQDVGFAEADPTTDIGGFDAAHKLSLLASIAFGTQVNLEAVQVRGIDSVGAEDIEAAKELGYRIKLIAVADRNGGSLIQRVHPALVPLQQPLAHVGGPGNSIVMQGDWVGMVEFGGPGAGEKPTASAVVADIIDIARGFQVPVFGTPATQLAPARTASEDHSLAPYYMRLSLADTKGTASTMTGILADHDISIETMIQRPAEDHELGANMPVIVVTYATRHAAIEAAIREIEAAGILAESPNVIRVESL
jgi:homoserine dehydrogenase